jgi:hypothetical protein
VFNTDDKPRRIRVPLSEMLMPDTAYTLFDVWAGKTLGKAKNTVSLPVEPHGAALLRIE